MEVKAIIVSIVIIAGCAPPPKPVAVVHDPTEYNLKDQSSPTWEERYELAVQLMLESGAAIDAKTGKPRHIKIADLGCGNERLADVLHEEVVRSALAVSFDYQGYDILPQSQAVIQMDLNRDFPRRRYDVVFALGLLEYLDDPNDFFRRLRRITDCAVMSYVFDDLDSHSREERQTIGWKNHMTHQGFIDLAHQYGWSPWGGIALEGGSQYVYVLTR